MAFILFLVTSCSLFALQLDTQRNLFLRAQLPFQSRTQSIKMLCCCHSLKAPHFLTLKFSAPWSCLSQGIMWQPRLVSRHRGHGWFSFSQCAYTAHLSGSVMVFPSSRVIDQSALLRLFPFCTVQSLSQALDMKENMTT